MKTIALGTLAAAAMIASALSAQAQATDPGVELAFMPRTMTVTLLNEGGKYVAIDLKHIPQGGTCRMDRMLLLRARERAPALERYVFATPRAR